MTGTKWNESLSLTAPSHALTGMKTTGGGGGTGIQTAVHGAAGVI